MTGEEALPKGRVEFMQYHQSTVVPSKWESSVVSDQWRLVRGKELYDIKADPGQNRDIAGQHPEVVRRLRAAHEAYWQEMQGTMGVYSPIYLGDDHENPTRLDAMDVLGDVAWSQISVALAQKSTGRWRVKFTRPGRYRFELRRWPRELGLSLGDTLEKEGISKLAPFADAVRSDEGTAWKETGKTKALAPQKAKLEFFGAQFEAEASGGQAGAVFPFQWSRREKRIYPPAL